MKISFNKIFNPQSKLRNFINKFKHNTIKPTEMADMYVPSSGKSVFKNQAELQKAQRQFANAVSPELEKHAQIRAESELAAKNHPAIRK